MAKTRNQGGCRCPSSPWSSSRTRAASARSTSTRGCCASASCSSARRSTTRSPTSSSPSCCTSRPRTPTRTSRCTSTRPGGVVYAGPGDLRHDAVHQARRGDDLLRDRDVDGLADPGRRRAGQALGAAEQRGSSSTSRPAASRARRPTSRSTPARRSRCARRIEEIYAEHTGQPIEEVSDGHRARPLLHARRRRPDYGLIDRVIDDRKNGNGNGKGYGRAEHEDDGHAALTCSRPVCTGVGVGASEALAAASPPPVAPANAIPKLRVEVDRAHADHLHADGGGGRVGPRAGVGQRRLLGRGAPAVGSEKPNDGPLTSSACAGVSGVEDRADGPTWSGGRVAAARA